MVKNKKKKAVILLPTFNEKENISRFVEEVLKQEVESPGWQYEILIVDSHSTDGTEEIAKKLAGKYSPIHFYSVDRGLGVALVKGHQYSIVNLKPDALVQLDADGQVAADVIPGMLQILDRGYDLVIGSRFVPGGKNELSPSRKFFTWGSSFFCRLVMGPRHIKEFSNSTRAFTPELFQRIDLGLVPWKEKTFIIQPSFLNAAVVAGAKYKEIPLVFRNRAVGYSKMKTINYTFDVVTYAIDARLKKWGLNIPFFRFTRRFRPFIGGL